MLGAPFNLGESMILPCLRTGHPGPRKRAVRLRRYLPRRPPLQAVLVVVTLALAATLWALGLGDLDIQRINDLGLISQASPRLLFGIALIPLAFTLAVSRPPLVTGLALLSVLLLILSVYGLPTFVEDAPRFATSYLHAAFTSVIAINGDLLPQVDGRFSWPLFFTFGALITQVAGIGNAIAIQPWAVLVSSLLYLGPLLLIFKSLTSDGRLVWTATFLFYAFNWIGQDYYSPQAFNYFLFLTVLAIVLHWFRVDDPPARVTRIIDWVDRRWPKVRAPARQVEESAQRPSPAPATARQRVALLAVIVLLTGVSVASHQLTPFALLAGLSALTVLGRMTLRGLPILVGVMIGTWISYMTVPFLAGHLIPLLSDLGAAGETASESVTQRIAGSPQHLLVVQIRLAQTLLLWLVAAAGAWRRFRHGNIDLEALALATVPFGLILLQAYGGEILLRVYLFSLPFMAFLAAGLFFPVPTISPSVPATRGLAVFLAVLVLLLMVTKHGNERAEYISADEVAGVDQLYSMAPAGSLLASANGSTPLRRDERIEQYDYAWLQGLLLSGDPGAITQAMDPSQRCAYLFLSRSQEAAAEMFNGIARSTWRHAWQDLLTSGRFRVAYRTTDAMILVPMPARAGCPV
jgi:hypothetical protein